MSVLEKALQPERIRFDIEADDWKSALTQGIALLKDLPFVSNYDALREEILHNQLENPTFLGNGLAVPHMRTNHVQQIVLSLLRLRNPLILANGEAVLYVIVAAIPKAHAAEYLQVIGCVARLFGKADDRRELDDCTGEAEFFHTLKRLSHAL